MQRVVVVGGGIVGSGIAQVVATAGLDVTLVDICAAALERARARIEKSLGTVGQGRAACRRRTRTRRWHGWRSTTDIDAAAEADHAIETVVEDLDIKRGVLAALDEALREDVVIASNTSQFSISLLAAATERPDRVIGSHWFNPPPVMDLIEIIRGVETSDATLATTLSLAQRYGKQTVVCDKDTPGFITSRLIVALGLEAMRIVEEGIASVEDVNTRLPARRSATRWGRSTRWTSPAWTPRCTSPTRCATSTASASSRRRTCACWSTAATSAARPVAASRRYDGAT